IVAQTGISGSSELGRNVVMGGQSATSGHLRIGDFSTIAARGGEYFENLDEIFPIIAKPSSDSAMFDNTLEFLALNGRTLEEAF
ncbi:hypothetical protein VWM73_12555, partial [Campylobacter coli]